MPFNYDRTVRFADIDGAGVVYFARIFSLCHEAYEASLAATGIDLREFFQPLTVAVPLVHAEANFRQPLYCGDRLTITLQPQQLNPHSYLINYQLFKQDTIAVEASTKHICIYPSTRSRQELPTFLMEWLTNFS
jgi:1,4-dihydroxy-2-naphthoyl-CoA hydrolase